MPATKKRKPQARRSPPGGGFRLPQLEQRPRPDRARARRGAVFFAFLIYLRAGTEALSGWLGGRRAEAADRRRVLRRAGGAARHRGDPGVARDAACGAAVPGRWAPCLFQTPHARPGRRDARSRPRRRGGALGRRLGAPRGGLVGRGCTGGSRPPSGWSARTSWRCSCSWPPPCASASIAGVVEATTDSFSTTTRDVRAAVQRRRATEELAALETSEPRVSRGTPPGGHGGVGGPGARAVRA